MLLVICLLYYSLIKVNFIPSVNEKSLERPFSTLLRARRGITSQVLGLQYDADQMQF